MDRYRDSSSVLRIRKLIEDSLEEDRELESRRSSEDLLELIRAAEQLSKRELH